MNSTELDLSRYSFDLVPLPQRQDLQSALETCARRAIDLALTEFTDTKDITKVTIRLATLQDQTEIQNLIKKYPTRLQGLDLITDRSPDFFSLLRVRGEAHVAVIGTIEGSTDIIALGSVAVRDGYLYGEKSMVAYLGDLLVVPNRKTFRLWRSVYAHLIEEVSRELGVGVFLTAILGENTLALRSLVERHNSNFIYEPVGQIRMLNILSSTPLLPTNRTLKSAALKTIWGDEATYQELCLSRAQSLRHGHIKPVSSGLPLIIKSKNGTPLLTARLVSPNSMKRLQPTNASATVNAAMRLLKISSDRPLSSLYLYGPVFHSELSPVDRRLAMMAAVEACYRPPIRKLVQQRSMLVVPDQLGLQARDFRGRLNITTRVQIFEVRSKSFMEKQNPRNALGMRDLGFEIVLV